MVIPHYFQELLEEVRKELQKVKEEIIEGEVVFYFKHIFWRHCASWKGPVLEGKKEEALPLISGPCFLPAFVQELRKRGSP